MSGKVKMNKVRRLVKRSVDSTKKDIRSKAGSIINKEMRSVRKEITDSMIKLTGLKRKVINDRLVLTRASNKHTNAKITAIFGRRLYMNVYPWVETVVRGGRKAIRLLAQIYRKNMRTAFMSRDGSRMYLRHERTVNGKTRYYVRAVRGRSVPRIFQENGYKRKYQRTTKDRVMKALRATFKGG